MKLNQMSIKQLEELQNDIAVEILKQKRNSDSRLNKLKDLHRIYPVLVKRDFNTVSIVESPWYEKLTPLLTSIDPMVFELEGSRWTHLQMGTDHYGPGYVLLKSIEDFASYYNKEIK